MGDAFIPFNRPGLLGGELERVKEALSGPKISGDGSFCRRSEACLDALLGTTRTLLTTSCTHALEMAAMLLDIGPGDEVIVPSFTFVSTANAFVLRGATPIFADVRADTLNLDEAHVAALITPRTRAIVPVHYAGVACNMDAFVELTKGRGISLVEDNAHGLFGKYRGRALGTFGALATLSFHETKNLTCGEGGALLVNDAAYAERAEILREKGTERARFFRGEVDKYTWRDIGSSFVLSEVLGALLFAQLEARAEIAARRSRIWRRYAEGLADWAAREGARLPIVPEECEHPSHLFYLVLPTMERRQALIAHLAERQIQAVFHYLPLHLSPMGERLGGKLGACPVTESMSERVLRLPFFNDLSEVDQARVIDAVCAFR